MPFQDSDPVVNLVSTALRQERLTGLPEILKCIATSAGAFGCILWQVAPNTEPERRMSERQLFVLSQWFADGSRCHLRLPIGTSVSGKALMGNEPVSVPDINRDPEVYVDSFLREARIVAMCSAPIRFLDEYAGTLNLYRNTPEPFAADEIGQIMRMASLLPSLYQTVRDKVSLHLLRKINSVLHEADSRSRGLVPERGDVRHTVQLICDKVAEAFQCREVSVFLRDGLGEAGAYEFVATTWDKDINKFTYRAEADDGLTGWVLAKRAPVQIFDLLHFNEDIAAIRRDYPGITWGDPFNIRGELEPGPSGEPPICSFMAVPITRGKNLYGVIRCNTARTGPSYFTERDVTLLSLVAAQIGQYWADWLKREVDEGYRKQIAFQKGQNEAFGNLAHQLKTPLFIAHARAQLMLRDANIADGLRSDIYAIRGNCGKAKRVTLNMKLLSSLVNKKPAPPAPEAPRPKRPPGPKKPSLAYLLRKILRGLAGDFGDNEIASPVPKASPVPRLPPERKRLTHSALHKILEEAAMDMQATTDPTRRIEYRLDSASLACIDSVEVYADPQHLEQVIGNVVENAWKYSYSDTVVRIFGGLTETGFHVTVENEGLPIREDEVSLCVTKEWRSEQAKWTTGEGHGLGLWLADEIMKESGGELIITPTNEASVTRVHLVFNGYSSR